MWDATPGSHHNPFHASLEGLETACGAERLFCEGLWRGLKSFAVGDAEEAFNQLSLLRQTQAEPLDSGRKEVINRGISVLTALCGAPEVGESLELEFSQSSHHQADRHRNLPQRIRGKGQCAVLGALRGDWDSSLTQIGNALEYFRMHQTHGDFAEFAVLTKSVFGVPSLLECVLIGQRSGSSPVKQKSKNTNPLEAEREAQNLLRGKEKEEECLEVLVFRELCAVCGSGWYGIRGTPPARPSSTLPVESPTVGLRGLANGVEALNGGGNGRGGQKENNTGTKAGVASRLSDLLKQWCEQEEKTRFRSAAKILERERNHAFQRARSLHTNLLQQGGGGMSPVYSTGGESTRRSVTHLFGGRPGTSTSLPPSMETLADPRRVSQLAGSGVSLLALGVDPVVLCALRVVLRSAVALVSFRYEEEEGRLESLFALAEAEEAASASAEATKDSAGRTRALKRRGSTETIESIPTVVHQQTKGGGSGGGKGIGEGANEESIRRVCALDEELQLILFVQRRLEEADKRRRQALRAASTWWEIGSDVWDRNHRDSHSGREVERETDLRDPHDLRASAEKGTGIPSLSAAVSTSASPPPLPGALEASLLIHQVCQKSLKKFEAVRAEVAHTLGRFLWVAQAFHYRRFLFRLKRNRDAVNALLAAANRRRMRQEARFLGCSSVTAERAEAVAGEIVRVLKLQKRRGGMAVRFVRVSGGKIWWGSSKRAVQLATEGGNREREKERRPPGGTDGGRQRQRQRGEQMPSEGGMQSAGEGGGGGSQRVEAHARSLPLRAVGGVLFGWKGPDFEALCASGGAPAGGRNAERQPPERCVSFVTDKKFCPKPRRGRCTGGGGGRRGGAAAERESERGGGVDERQRRERESLALVFEDAPSSSSSFCVIEWIQAVQLLIRRARGSTLTRLEPPGVLLKLRAEYRLCREWKQRSLASLSSAVFRKAVRLKREQQQLEDQKNWLKEKEKEKTGGGEYGVTFGQGPDHLMVPPPVLSGGLGAGGSASLRGTVGTRGGVIGAASPTPLPMTLSSYAAD
uniref:Uncharacterized protein n=1 Tax=Chromera velia CCMP2878 TaxID=1169474 RepID=A0A0G4G1H9_9ALVE|eukprot:Cvel_19639.t1-p1 / transcript=Cvel_19639.t1 / gene=Cvel_19639 / organism=Chromera_velia_CCMP2878 / gene_product=hypothetical protein / transcript_product=hypothetical protein / location=Cvel_scaffold1710:26563-36461(-) / protein_length=1036 / sequence_SO=supercontig / SO=protein_coding / is_pseudo=false